MARRVKVTGKDAAGKPTFIVPDLSRETGHEVVMRCCRCHEDCTESKPCKCCRRGK